MNQSPQRSNSVVVTGGSGFIGTNLVAALRADGLHVVNYDRAPPLNPAEKPSWRAIDLLNATAVRNALQEDRPYTVYHLAAETRIDGVDADFACNINTTRNLLDAAAEASVTRTILASTMLVHPLGTQPRSELPGEAVTAYGRSKAAMEQMIRAHPWRQWSIIRPTTIWGPWHLRLANEFISRVAKGRYLHPDVPCYRSYGYVENVCHQMRCIASSDAAIGRTLYVGDKAIALAAYVDAFSNALRNRSARRAPLPLLAITAKFGDFLRLMHIPFPLSSYRLSNMTQDNVIDMSATFEIAGAGPVGLEEGITRTIAWWKAKSR